MANKLATCKNAYSLGGTKPSGANDNRIIKAGELTKYGCKAVSLADNRLVPVSMLIKNEVTITFSYSVASVVQTSNVPAFAVCSGTYSPTNYVARESATYNYSTKMWLATASAVLIPQNTFIIYVNNNFKNWYITDNFKMHAGYTVPNNDETYYIK